MTDTLEAWWDGLYVGQFRRKGDQVTFSYDPGAPPTPISVSLPRHGRATRYAAARYLENLLPDNEAVRRRWAMFHGTGAGTFDLLAAVGQDVAGAIVLLPTGTAPNDIEEPALLISQDDLAARILSLRQDPDAWHDPATSPTQRFSLAGTQGKFTATRIGEQWFWPNANLPSTHIVKPARQDLTHLGELEAGALSLASRLGIAAPRAEVMTFRGQRSYVVERFDRDVTGEIPRRLHAEDFAQALGVGPDRKYQVSARNVIELLRAVDPEEHQLYRWVRMLAFNTHVGNSDAHAKNYSLLLRPDHIELASLYDSLPTQFWPQFDNRLAMRIGGQSRSSGISTDHWAKFARSHGLDADRVVQAASDVASGITIHAPEVFIAQGLAPRAIDGLTQLLARTTGQMHGC